MRINQYKDPYQTSSIWKVGGFSSCFLVSLTFQGDILPVLQCASRGFFLTTSFLGKKKIVQTSMCSLWGGEFDGNMIVLGSGSDGSMDENGRHNLVMFMKGTCF